MKTFSKFGILLSGLLLGGQAFAMRTDGNINVDFNRWVNWDTPALQ